MRPSVRHTAEFTRVAALPRRTPTEETARAWAAELTPLLSRPGSGVALRPWQGFALGELLTVGGAWLAYPVGQGKTLIAELAPVVVQAERAVLIIPASLRDKTLADRAALLRAGWLLASPPPQIITRESLALEANAQLLERIRPDLIVIDEADDLANVDAAAPQRIARYVEGMGAEVGVAVLAMTATPSRNAPRAYWHILAWALGDGAPVPLDRTEADAWDAALGERPGPRPRPGPLGVTLGAAREWYRDRLAQTPGVVILDQDSCDAPLSVRLRIAPEDATLDGHYRTFAREWESPTGEPVSDPLSRARIDGQLGTGVVLYWDPPPPPAWLDARRAFCKFVRGAIERSRHGARPLDTEAQVARCYADHAVVRTWREIGPTFRPNSVPMWVTDSTVDAALAWAAESPEPGIIWCGGVEFARRLAARGGLPYYSRQGLDARGVGLHAADPSRSLVVSWQANKRGHNLQAWRRQLIIQPPSSAKFLEQMFGRSHRAGQDNAVAIDVLATSGGTIDAFTAAVAEADFVRSSLGMRQKILRADIRRDTPPSTPTNRYRWATARPN